MAEGFLLYFNLRYYFNRTNTRLRQRKMQIALNAVKFRNVPTFSCHPECNEGSKSCKIKMFHRCHGGYVQHDIYIERKTRKAQVDSIENALL